MIDPFDRLFAKVLNIPRGDVDGEDYHGKILAKLEGAKPEQLFKLYEMGCDLFRYNEDNRKRHIRALQRGADEAQQLVQDLEAANAQKTRTLDRLAELVSSLGKSKQGQGDDLEELVDQIKELVEAQKRHTAEIDRARKIAVDAAEARSRFLANMSHEIRTPMNGIMGTLNLISEDSLGEEDRSYLDVMRRSIRALITVLNDILDFSKIQEGGVEISTARFCLADLCGDVHKTFRLAASEKGIGLHLKLADDLPSTVLGDETRLRQILNNLVGNATKFTEQGSVTFRISREAKQFMFEIVDTGIGMNEEAISRLFSPFSQADDSITRRFGGTGLGLSISKNLAELMGGSIGLQSEAGKGSTFVLRLPLEIISSSDPTSLKQPESDQSIFLDAQSGYHLRVLVAEDNAINQLVAQKTLEKFGHEVTIASDGREALQLASSNDFDVILMDLEMPIMDGLEAAKAIRKLPGAKGRLRILAMTGHALAESREACSEAGINGFIPKPFDLVELRDALLPVA